MLPIQIVQRSLRYSVVSALILSFILMSLYMVLEPVIGRAATDTFTVRQQITSEISFLVPAADVTMVGAIAGISGGNATGTTYAVVRTNNAAGYTMDIAFSGSPAMRGEVSGSTAIKDYVGAEPSYTFVASSSSLFAYSVTASSSTDVDPSFLNNGAACNTGSTSTADACWKGASTTDFRIVNRNTEAGTGATTTITFVVNVPSNPSPAVQQDYYTATATLTALNQ